MTILTNEVVLIKIILKNIAPSKFEMSHYIFCELHYFEQVFYLIVIETAFVRDYSLDRGYIYDLKKKSKYYFNKIYDITFKTIKNL